MIRAALALLLALALPAGDALPVFGDGGLRSLTLDGLELLVDGTPSLSATWPKEDGGSEPARGEKGAKPPTASWDAATRTLTRDFGWAQLAVVYAPPQPGRLDAVATVRNTGSLPLRQVSVSFARLQAPGLPEWFGRDACSRTGPPVVGIASSAWSGAWCEPGADEAKPACLDVQIDKGRPGKDGTAAAATVLLRIGSGDGKIILHDVQLSRPIAPGASDSYAVSLRLAAAGAPLTTLAADAFAEHAKRRPQTITWADRRPILRCFWGGGLKVEQLIANAKDPANAQRPTTTAKFRENAINKVKGMIAGAKACDAQGVIMWDLEGDAYPHPTTYIGDPRLIAEFHPEMDGVADELMKMLADAKLLSGICIRPSHVLYDDKKGKHWHSHSAQPDPQRELDEKIAYARKRWGCRLFYIDTSVFWKPYPPEQKWEASFISPDIWKTLAAKYPDVLLIPESVVPNCQAHTAPYTEADMGGYSLPASITAVWPGAFRVIVIEDADPWENFDRFVRASRDGNPLMTFGQSPTHQNVVAIQHIRATVRLEDAGVPPTVAAAAPTALAGLLSDADATVRFHAARALTKAKTVGAATALARCALSTEEVWPVRRAALAAMAVQGIDDTDVPAVLALVVDPTAYLHSAAGLVLANGGPAAHAALDAALRSAATTDPGRNRNPPFIRLCDAAAASTDAALAATIRGLLPALGDKRLSERRAAVEALGRLRDRASVTDLTALMLASGGGLQVACVEALARIGEPESLAKAKALVEEVRKTDKDHAYQLNRALGAK